MMNKDILNLSKLRHWFDRILFSDPGRIRLFRSFKVILSVLTSVVLLNLIIKGQMTAVVLGAAFSMMSIMMVVEQEKQQKMITTILLPFAAGIAITINALLSTVGYHLSDIFLVIAIFLAFYLQQFGMRYFSLSMAGFFSIYISSLLHVQFGQLIFLYIALFIGTLVGFIYNFFILDISSNTLLKRTMTAYHRRMNRTYNLIIDGIRDSEPNTKRLRKINHNMNLLSDYARMLSGQLESTHPSEVWPGVTPRLLRIYVFDTQMLLETLYPAFKKLKFLHALDHINIRHALLNVIEALRDADVLEVYSDPSHLKNAQIATDGLRKEVSGLNTEQEDIRKWLYLLRRIESIANHVINEAKHLQHIRQTNLHHHELVEENQNASDHNKTNEEDTEEKNKDNRGDGLQFTTKKAIQASVAGSISIIAGYLLSPSHQYWVILTAFVVLLGTESVGRTSIKAFQRSSGTIIGAIVGFGLASILPPDPIVKVILLLFCLFMAFYIFIISYSVMIFWITMMVAMMYDLLMGGITPLLLGDRVIDTLIGSGLGLLVTIFLFPKRTSEKVNEATEEFLESLQGYVTSYLNTFIGKTHTANLTDKAFYLDEKLQVVRDESEPLRKRLMNTDRSDIGQRITVLTAINYYAKQLIASSHRHNHFDINDYFHKNLQHIETSLTDNITSLCQLFYGKGHPDMWRLDQERDLFERSPDVLDLSPEQKTEFIHDFYYIWRINSSLVALGEELGAYIKHANERDNE